MQQSEESASEKEKAPPVITTAGAFCFGIALTLGLLSSRALSFRAIWTK